MTFDEWWASITEAERKLIGRTTSKYVWLCASDNERENVSKWMIDRSYATGHGDTIEDLLKELEWQIRESEREACSQIAESYEPRCDTCPSGVANAIRARES